jgi:sporulation protein YlmC with PRC-barrel domain
VDHVRLELGLAVDCSDGPGGTVRDVVVDPARRRVTHVVVEHRRHVAYLVPVEDIEPATPGSGLRLMCTVAELVAFPEVEESAFLRLGEWPELQDHHWDVGTSSVLSLPSYYNADLGGPAYPPLADDRLLMTYDRIPAHEIELRRGSSVEAADGTVVGLVDSVIVDDHERVTHLVLERGHLWGRRDITIPVEAVKRLRTDSVELSLTPAEVGALTAVHGHRHRARHGR